MTNSKTYPTILQSWGIAGIAILTQFIFAPVQLGLANIVSKEFALLIYYSLAMGSALAFAYFIRKKETGLKRFTFDLASPKNFILVSFGVLGLQIGVLSPITDLIPMPELFKQMFLEIGNMKGVFAFLTLVVAAPILEELIFRGIILDGLLKKYAPFKSIFLSSLLFGIVHLNPWQFIAALGIGFFMGWVYHKTGKLSLCIIIHFVNNLFAFLSTQFTNLEEEINKSFVESCGGPTNAVLVILGGAGVFIICYGLLRKEFKKQNSTTA